MGKTRKITFYATKGGKKAVESGVETWGDLRPLVAESYDLSNLQATESITKHTLTHKDAVLPKGTFVLFLRPIKTKSGLGGTVNLGFRALRDLVTTDDIKKHLNAWEKGKNWTQLGTEALRAGLSAYELPTSPGPRVADEVVKEAVDKCVKTVQDTRGEMTVDEKAALIDTLLSEICEELEDNSLCERVESIKDEVQGLITDVAAAKADKEETIRIKAEFTELLLGFID